MPKAATSLKSPELVAPTPDARIQSVARAKALLDAMASGEWLSLRLLAERTGLAKTTAFNLVTALVDVGLERFREARPDKLSGGQRQRVAIARALVVDPALVIADEPTANLDSENSRMVVDLMREMNREHKVTFVFTTHDPRLLDHVDRKILLRDGCIESDEAMETLEAA